MVKKVDCNSGGYERIPYAAEQGNNSLDLGIGFPAQGIFIAERRLPTILAFEWSLSISQDFDIVTRNSREFVAAVSEGYDHDESLATSP